MRQPELMRRPASGTKSMGSIDWMRTIMMQPAIVPT